jgi:hypothetical protein
MSENSLRRVGARRSPFPRGLLKRLSKSGYRIERGYVSKMPTVDEVFLAIESGVPIWLHMCWLIRKTRQRAPRRAPAPTGTDVSRK